MTNSAEQRTERRRRLTISQKDGEFLLRLDNIQALDHSDVCLLKEWMSRQDNGTKVSLNLHKVEYLPSGFFGMLHDISDTGVRITLLNVTDAIKKQIWFKQFIQPSGLFMPPKKAWTPGPE